MRERTAFTVVLVTAMLVAVAASGIAHAGSVNLEDAVLGEVPDGQRDIQETIWFQGYVADSGTGEPVTATYTVAARIYDADVGGGTVWGTETHGMTPIVDGWFSIELGSVEPPLPAFDDPPYFLQLWINGEELSPRLKLASVPSAFQASATDAAESDWSVSGPDVYRPTGSVGVGTATPGARLDVTAGSEPGAMITNSGGEGHFALEASNSVGTAAGFFSQFPVPGYPGVPVALYAAGANGSNGAFISARDGGTGVIAQSIDSGPALQGWAYGTGLSGHFFGGSGVQVDGHLAVNTSDLVGASVTSDYESSATTVVRAEFTGSSTYDAIAVYGLCTPQDYYGFGGRFVGGYKGVEGAVHPTGSNTYYGIRGRADGGSGTNYGIYVSASGSGTNWAGYFAGDAQVTGTLSKGAGSFKIDHPLDPANKYLYHSFVESPDMMNVYNGNVVLDGAGEAWIEMPEWFDTLNRDFRYQLTCIGGFAPVYVSEKMAGNRFRIAGGEPDMEVSWQVTGIRQDKFAEANRIPVEETKSPKERGKYMHPEVFGLSRSMSIEPDESAKGGE